MDIFQDRTQQALFNTLINLTPSTPAEYNRMVGNALHEISEIFSIERVEIRSDLSVAMLADVYPTLSKNVIYDSGRNIPCKEFRYQKNFPMNSINFKLYVNSEKELTNRDIYTLDLIMNHFITLLNTVILRASCEIIYLTDQNMGIYNLEGLFRFMGMLIAKETLDKYTAIYFNIHNFKSIYRAVSYLDASKVLANYCKVVTNAITKQEVVALIGGDNFVALVLDQHKDYFLDLVQNMVVKFDKNGEKLTFSFGATVGAAKLSDEKNPGEIMMHITQAYQSARESRVPLAYYDQKISNALIDKKITLSRFGKAITNHEFFALYQPKVDAKTHTLLGAEALVRWKHNGEMQMPGTFIPILENDGCITALDFYMLEEVCKFLGKLRRNGIELVKISVNFSKRHLSNNKLVEEIAEVIDRYEIPHEYIEIELTESENFQNQMAMKGIVDDLNVLGIKTSIDDFGTGYSSLSMLKTLQVEELKIDRSFIPKAANDKSDDKSLYLLKGVISLAKNLGLTIVAEGVETPEQLDLIKGMECDIVQGYIFDRPLPEEEFIERIKQKVYKIK